MIIDTCGNKYYMFILFGWEIRVGEGDYNYFVSLHKQGSWRDASVPWGLWRLSVTRFRDVRTNDFCELGIEWVKGGV
jgi:hypothetical protein